MKIEVLKSLTKEEFENLGHDGYESSQIYKLTLDSNDYSIIFKLKLENLKENYVKDFGTTSNDIDIYNDLMIDGYSFGAYTNELVGFAICEVHDWNNSLYISNFIVSQKERQKGIGKQLMEKIIENAKNKKIRLIELETQNTNVPAIKFYQKQGFKITGIKSNLYDNEVIEKAIFMTFEI